MVKSTILYVLKKQNLQKHELKIYYLSVLVTRDHMSQKVIHLKCVLIKHI